MKHKIVILFQIICLGLHAQNARIDSLEQVLRGRKSVDTTYINTEIELSDALSNIDLVRAKKLALSALEHSREIKFDRSEAYALRQAGIVTLYQSDYLKSVDYSLKALSMAEKLGDGMLATGVLNNIGNVYADLRDFKKAHHYYKRCLDNATRLGLKTFVLFSLVNIGSIYVEERNFEKGLPYLEKGLALSRKMNNRYAELSCLNNLAVAYARLKQSQKALTALDEVRQMAQELSATAQLITSNLETARVLNDLKREREAVAFGLESLRLSEKEASVGWQVEASSTLSHSYEKLKMPDSALYFYKKYVIARDKMFNDDLKSGILEKQKAYETEKKEIEFRESVRREKITQWAIGIISFLILITVAVIFIALRKRQKAKSLHQELLWKAQLSDTEMKMLRLQLNPHFIFNSLNSISDYIRKNDPDTADYFLSKFAKLMRATLENSAMNEIPLSEELDMLRTYIELESSRLRGKLDYEIIVSDDIDPETLLVPPLMLQLFVENSILHGIAAKEGNGKIIIDIRRDQELLHCVIEDDGNGMGEKKPNHNSHGIRITKERIRILNKMKKTNASVHYVDVEKGTKVQLNLPIEEDL